MNFITADTKIYFLQKMYFNVMLCFASSTAFLYPLFYPMPILFYPSLPSSYTPFLYFNNLLCSLFCQFSTLLYYQQFAIFVISLPSCFFFRFPNMFLVASFIHCYVFLYSIYVIFSYSLQALHTIISLTLSHTLLFLSAFFSSFRFHFVCVILVVLLFLVLLQCCSHHVFFYH